MSIWDSLQGVAEPEFSISSLGLGHLTSNLGYLAKSAKCRVHFLGHEMSNCDETWYVGRGRSVMHDVDFSSQDQGQGHGHGGPKVVKYGPRPDR